MKRQTIKIAIATILCVALVAIFVACQNPFDIVHNDNNYATSEEYTNNLVAVSASSSALILDEMQSASANISTQDSSMQGKPLTDEEIEEVKAQLAILENYMGDNAPKVVQEDIQLGDVYYGKYAYKMAITTKDMHGNDYNYSIYYNQEKLSQNNNTDKDNDDDDFDDLDDKFEGLFSGANDEEIEENFKITGIVVSGENVYEMTGIRKYESETDDGETEIENTFKMTVKQSENDYIVFEQSTEQEGNESEESYEYKIYSNGQMVKNFELEFENELKEQEVEMKTIENGEIFSVKYESKIVNGKEVIEAEVTKDGKIVEVIIRAEGNGTEQDPYRHIYTYGDIEDIEYDD